MKINFLVGLFFFLCTNPSWSTSLSQQLWQELEVAKSQEEFSTSKKKQEESTDLSAADVAFMESELEGELKEDSVSMGLAAPIRSKESVKKINEGPSRFRSRSRPVSKKPIKTMTAPKPVRERSR